MASRTLYPKVLFFIAGTTPTKEQLEAANGYGPGVVFRNATLIHPDGPIEEADAVAGDTIPDNYAKALPNVSNEKGVKERMSRSDPNNQTMVSGDEPKDETPEETKARIDNALSRGQRRPSINERNSQPTMVEARTTQAGTPRVEYPDEKSDWQTNPETINDAAAQGRGIGETEGDAGQVGKVPVGPQGEGGPGHRDKPKDPTSGAGNPRTPAGKR